MPALSAAETSTNGWKELAGPTLLGAGLNIAAFGFLYGVGNHTFELAMVNWMRDPSLYPRDPIRGAFERLPTIFWRIVSLVPQQISTEGVLAVFFVLTKLLFFYALARIVRYSTGDLRFTRLVAVLFALSPMLNARLPFGADHLLDPVETHTALGIALLVCAGAWLLERKWISAAILTAACLYMSAPFAIFMLFAFVVFAVADWQLQRRKILASALIGAILMLPFAIADREHVVGTSPPEYVRALLLFYPFHLKFSAHPLRWQILGPGFIFLTAAIVLWARSRGAGPNRRLELMALSFVFPVLLGVVAGEWFLTPFIARLQLMRADTFLFCFSALLLANAAYALVRQRESLWAYAALAIGAFAFLLPATPLRLLLLALGILLALWPDIWNAWVTGRIKTLVQMWPLLRALSPTVIRMAAPAALVTLLAILIVAAWKDPRSFEQFSPHDRPMGEWMNVQTWARDNTSRDAVFLVPTGVEGFRIFSRRSSWGEWKDGNGVYFYPALAPNYISEMKEVGLDQSLPANEYGTLNQRYEAMPWERLVTIAREHKLQYIIQFRGVTYPGEIVYANSSYEVYRVPS